MVSLILAGMIAMSGITAECEPPDMIQPLDGVKACERCISEPEEMIKVACNWYGIDHDIPLAIAKLETGNFTSEAFKQLNNVGGMSVNEEPVAYRSMESGVDAFVGNLAQNYFSQGFTTVEQISRKYCPVNAKGWAEVVNALLEE